MKLISSIVLLIFFFQFSNAQLKFQKSFGVNYYPNTGSDIQPTFDNGYIIGGKTSGHQINGVSDLCMIKVDEFGTGIWSKYAGAGMVDNIQHIRQTNDSGFIAVGSTSLTTNVTEIMLLKTNSLGVIQWNKKVYSTSGLVLVTGFEILSNGDIVIIGNANFVPTQPAHLFIMRLDASGNSIWSRSYHVNYILYGNRILETSNGDLLVGGYSSHTTPYGTYSFLLKVNQSGTPLWNKAFSINYLDRLSWVEKTNDGGFILGGSVLNTNPDSVRAFIIKTDSLGNRSWSKIYGDTNAVKCSRVLQTNDFGYAILGSYDRWHASNEDYICLLKTDSQGNFSWSKIYGDTNTDKGLSFLQTHDRGYLITGNKTGHASTYGPIYLIKTDSSGSTSCMDYDVQFQSVNQSVIDTNVTVIDTVINFSFSTLNFQNGSGLAANVYCSTVDITSIPDGIAAPSIYPNPAENYIQFINIEGEGTISIYNSIGSLILRRQFVSKVDVSNYPSGIYFAKLHVSNKYSVIKFIIERN